MTQDTDVRWMTIYASVKKVPAVHNSTDNALRGLSQKAVLVVGPPRATAPPVWITQNPAIITIFIIRPPKNVRRARKAMRLAI